ncbi:MAG: secreted enzyme, sortase [Microgenomates group bacterium GW2011_GWF2_45_18]|nr:MAG: secreted enzyme, sortase [Microgenomates group bacterium GW2011_GWF1_44_10]KKU01669.1 MAG: secreted enzyme, sortase [Microgenomates group bacterium GW2011_GWF2_45_18]OGJ40049.1 MAG: hypothetical protein A2378_01055 [Candidatus Pacebacteria bacterium RIFOXYB1_FULL_44_10]HAU98984.1 hypothetical protein [Candidatus Paceibacterota bacterium]HAX01641.1 hypothetical protein [Candidatus Paceibacterota bacterium]
MKHREFITSISIDFSLDSTKKAGEILLEQAKRDWAERRTIIGNWVVLDQAIDDEVEHSIAGKIRTLSRATYFKLIHPVTYAVSNFLASTSMVLGMSSILFLMAPYFALEFRSLVMRSTNSFLPSAEYIVAPATTQEKEIAPEDHFRIRIPEINVDAQVIANVDASDPESYEPALQKGIAHAKGSGFPSDLDGAIPDYNSNKTMFLFAHSTDASWNVSTYNAIFYSLKDLEVGNTVEIVFWGESHWYSVKETKIVAADDVSLLQPQTEKEQVILQTCWPPGTTWKRLLVVAEKAE